VPIDNPLPERADRNEARRGYSFRGYHRFGSTDLGRDGRIDLWAENSLAVLGPVQAPAPYRFLCELTLNWNDMSVFCRDWAALHEYLNYAAPLVSVFQQERVASVLGEVFHWIFDEDDGLLNTHVRRRKEEYWARKRDTERHAAKESE
jgi:hypothetical protein